MNGIDLHALRAAFYGRTPAPNVRGERVAFGTSGHRGTSLSTSYNEAHVVAITQAICEYRTANGIDGPLFIGIDTHELSEPAYRCAMEVLAGNGTTVCIPAESPYAPTPAISHAILRHNRSGKRGLADGIVLSPSHNPPTDGGYKYNPPHGGPADTDVTRVIEAAANRLLESGTHRIPRVPFDRALQAGTTHRHPVLAHYVGDLHNVIDFDIIRDSGIRVGVDPLGGAGIDYWPRIAEAYRIDLTVLRNTVDKTFSFMSPDWDGQIRMDPSSAQAMRPLIAQRAGFDVTFACDTDHDRHGIVTPDGGLVPSNDYLAVCIDYLLTHRPQWNTSVGIGKTIVSSAMIDRVVSGHNRRLYEVPVGFKWFVDGLLDGSLGFVGEESAGASFLRKDGTVWSTDKDGIIAGLLAAEITARTGVSPTKRYALLAERYGAPVSKRIDSKATVEQKARFARITPADFALTEFAGEAVQQVVDRAPGNNAPIGGIQLKTANAWFAARPSGTENIYKLYAESFLGADHLERVLEEAQGMLGAVLTRV